MNKMNELKVSKHLKNTCPESLCDAHWDEKSGQEVMTVPQESIKQVISILKEELFYDMLVDIVAIDWKKSERRYELDYLLYNTKENSRVNLKVFLNDNENPLIDSICDVHKAANWAEREAFDMMGIGFKGHPKLK